MKASVDKDKCIACGLCPSICPEVFSMSDDGHAQAVPDKVPEESEDTATEAGESCPTGAISVE